MKNVAKCDTWCELQNPVNHRVFERKLRPKPFGRGHVCLGVTHRVAPRPARLAKGRGAETGLPFAIGVRLAQMRSLGDSRHGKWWLNTQSLAPSCRCVVLTGVEKRPCGGGASRLLTFDRDPRSGGITR